MVHDFHHQLIHEEGFDNRQQNSLVELYQSSQVPTRIEVLLDNACLPLQTTKAEQHIWVTVVLGEEVTIQCYNIPSPVHIYPELFHVELDSWRHFQLVEVLHSLHRLCQ